MARKAARDEPLQLDGRGKATRRAANRAAQDPCMVLYGSLSLEEIEMRQNPVTVTWAEELAVISVNSPPVNTITAAVREGLFAAIADIRSSTKETAAIFNLAQLLYKKGDVKNASSYIEAAIRDASFYGARQRKVQVSAILPLIEGEKVSRVEEQKSIFVTWSIISTFLLLVVIVLAIMFPTPEQGSPFLPVLICIPLPPLSFAPRTESRRSSRGYDVYGRHFSVAV